MARFFFPLLTAVLAACGGGSNPTEVELGKTSLIVWVNPTMNEATNTVVATPGTIRGGVRVWIEDGPQATTDDDGVAVLSPVPSGDQTIRLQGGGHDGTVSLRLVEKDLRELAVALVDSGAQVIADIPYSFSGRVIEVTPAMSEAEINAALAESGQIVLFGGGTYVGNYDFGGSAVTLFGAGTTGGRVTIRGTVTNNGSGNRIRGTFIDGSLSVPGSEFGLTSSRVQGALTIIGSSAVVIDNQFCGDVSFGGSGNVILGNAGAAPTPAGDCSTDAP